MSLKGFEPPSVTSLLHMPTGTYQVITHFHPLAPSALHNPTTHTPQTSPSLSSQAQEVLTSWPACLIISSEVWLQGIKNQLCPQANCGGKLQV
jgi:hypothetical protein